MKLCLTASQVILKNYQCCVIQEKRLQELYFVKIWTKYESLQKGYTTITGIHANLIKANGENVKELPSEEKCDRRGKNMMLELKGLSPGC